MKCAYHNDVDAVATCNICGKALCTTCASQIKPPQCIGCYKDNLAERMNEIKGSLMNDILLGIGSAILFPVIFYYTGGLSGNIFSIIFSAALVPFGWRFLNKITPNIFLFLPLIGWLIYFGVKFVLSVCVGFIAAPVTIAKRVHDMKKIQQLIDNVKDMDNKSLIVER